MKSTDLALVTLALITVVAAFLVAFGFGTLKNTADKVEPPKTS